MKAKVIPIDGYSPAKKSSKEKNLKTSKIHSLVKKIRDIYKDKEIHGYFNYPGFNRG